MSSEQSGSRTGLHALVVADGDVPDRARLDAAWPGWAERVGLVVAADGGARKAARLGLRPDLVVGDADSLPASELARVRAEGVPIEMAPEAKDESDLELAARAAVRRGATALTVLGALGGRRFDHSVANVSLLALPDLQGRDVELLDASTRVTLLRAPGADGGPIRRAFPGLTGELVSLLPLGERAEGVVTEGLRYPLRDEPLWLGPSRGLSNVRTAPEAAVSLRRGLLLVIETRTASGGRG